MTPFPPESKVPDVPSAFKILVDSCDVITIYDNQWVISRHACDANTNRNIMQIASFVQ